MSVPLNGATLPPDVFAALAGEATGCTGIVATIDPDGRAHMAPFGSVWAPAPERVRFGCDRRHATFQNLGRDARVAVSLILPPDIAVTVFGRARVAREGMDEVPTDAVVELQVEEVKDDMLPGSTIESAVRYSVPEAAGRFVERYMAEIRRV